MENVILEIPMPKSVLNCILNPSQGKYTFDPVTKILVWDVGRIDISKVPNIRGTVSFNIFYLLKVLNLCLMSIFELILKSFAD